MTDTEIKNNISFYQAGDLVPSNDYLKSINQKIAELSSIKNISFLFGAGTSSEAIPGMQSMQLEIKSGLDLLQDKKLKKQYEKIKSPDLEEKLTILYALKHYLEGTSGVDGIMVSNVNNLISHIESEMYSKINVDLSSDNAIKAIDVYKILYQKLALRNKDLSRLNIFTTNNDLFNEKALDSLNINYNNGFSGGLDRVFNPARFHYTFSKKIDTNLEKFEPLDNMVYLYKLHGSISWVEQDGGDSLFNIREVPVKGGVPKDGGKHVLIYPTPLKQSQCLGSPYADLIREFQTKLSLPNSAIFIIGYSFSDEHLNNIIYQALASNSSLSVVIFGKHPDCPLSTIKDSRIYRVFGEDLEGSKVHYFEYIVKNLLPNVDENIDTLLLEKFVTTLKAAIDGESAK